MSLSAASVVISKKENYEKIENRKREKIERKKERQKGRKEERKRKDLDDPEVNEPSPIIQRGSRQLPAIAETARQ